MGQRPQSQSFHHAEHTELQSHIWLEGEEPPKKVNKLQTMTIHSKYLFYIDQNSFSKESWFENTRKLYHSRFTF